MEQHKEMMKTSLSEDLRELMEKHLFEKITIKQICDQTGVIRATFYNYFDDKYDCLNWIVRRDMREGNEEYYEKGEMITTFRNVLNRISENRAFYRTAYNVTGQNSFEDMIRNNITEVLEEYFERFRNDSVQPDISNRLLSQYYAESLAFFIRTFVFEREGISIDEVVRRASTLMTHSFSEFAKKDEK